MIDTFLALVPDYGLLLVFSVVFLACLAIPLPASMLVLAAGSFAAAGDLVLWQVLAATFIGFVGGDHTAFAIARLVGPRLLSRFEASPRTAPTLARSNAMLESRGRMAIFLSHTIFSPTCAYVTYLSGVGGLGWSRFSGVAIAGSLLWSVAYVSLGYVFADQLEEVALLLSDFFAVVLAGAVALLALMSLRRRWKLSGKVVASAAG